MGLLLLGCAPRNKTPVVELLPPPPPQAKKTAVPDKFARGLQLLEGYDQPSALESWRVGDQVLCGIEQLHNGKREIRYAMITVRTLPLPNGKKLSIGPLPPPSDRSADRTYLAPLYDRDTDKNPRGLTARDWKLTMKVNTPDGKPHPLSFHSSQILMSIALFDEELELVGESHSVAAERYLRKGLYDIAEDLFELSRKLGPDFPRIYREQPERFRIRIQRMAEIIVTMFAIRDTLWSTPTLIPMLMKTVQKPSLWSIIKRRGVDSRIVPRFDLIESGARPLPAFPGKTPLILPFDVVVNDETALNCRLFVVPAESPLMPTAGVVGVEAAHPTDPDRKIMLTVLAARRGAPVGELVRK